MEALGAETAGLPFPLSGPCDDILECLNPMPKKDATRSRSDIFLGKGDGGKGDGGEKGGTFIN